ncbi:MAG TPA: LysM peptidoglycan-binding domain-containing protein [Anaerolineales bacterium]|nr:LysM peptidoglycan-binding domain-containing protein [Anaerolineales bacterium]
MATMKRGALVASILMLVSIIASACNQPYSQPPSVTNTPINPNSLFATPLGNSTQMSDVERFATGTALALTGTPASALVTQTPQGGAPQTVTQTATPVVALNPTSTSTATLAVSGTLSTALPPGTSPPTYILQKGEWPYCIARRFDVNPKELLDLNNLPSGDIYYPNLVLKIPQTGNRFPPPRAFRTHPTTYTVTASDQTVSGVACLFGDVYPSAIAQANGISESSAVTVGQVLSIP